MHCTKSSMESVCKYGRLSSIPFLKSSIPFHFGIFHIPYQNFPFIPFSIDSIPCTGCRVYIIIVTFYPNGCSQFENAEAPDFEEIASASSSFSTLLLPSSLPLLTSFIKVLPLPQKINCFHRLRFQLPLPHSCYMSYAVGMFIYLFFNVIIQNFKNAKVICFIKNNVLRK